MTRPPSRVPRPASRVPLLATPSEPVYLGDLSFVGALTRLSREYQHITADFLGVPANQLADRALISGLVVAAASAAGMHAGGIPTMRERTAGGLTAALLHDDCHITVHAVPERELLLVDVLAPRAIDASRAVDVFARRLTARNVHRDARDRA